MVGVDDHHQRPRREGFVVGGNVANREQLGRREAAVPKRDRDRAELGDRLDVAAFDFLKALRADPAWTTIPVAILTLDLAVSAELLAEVEALHASVRTGVIPRDELLQPLADLCA